MSGKAYVESGVSIAIPAPENPAKKANRKNALFFVIKYKIIDAEEKSHKCSGSPSFQ